MARIISDYILSKDFGIEYKYFSISSAIAKDRKNYYDKLERSQNLTDNPNLDCTPWISWYLDVFNSSLQETLGVINKIMKKTQFWDKVRHITLNQRQLKVLGKLLEYNEGEFQGGLTTKKYLSMTKTSIATAKRDIQELVSLGCLEQIEGAKGRNTQYKILF
jgi:Fic family protein